MRVKKSSIITFNFFMEVMNNFVAHNLDIRNHKKEGKTCEAIMSIIKISNQT